MVSRKLLLLRAHHLIRKVPRTHRCLLTKAGRIAVTALIGDGAHVLNVGEIADHCGFSPWNCRKRRIGARLIAPVHDDPMARLDQQLRGHQTQSGSRSQ